MLCMITVDYVILSSLNTFTVVHLSFVVLETCYDLLPPLDGHEELGFWELSFVSFVRNQFFVSAFYFYSHILFLGNFLSINIRV